MQISRFEDLTVHQEAYSLQQAIFDLTTALPREERYALTDQIRRSSRSIGANLAEAWKKRRYPAHFVSKLSDADAELAETRHWLHTASSCGYLDDTAHNDLCSQTHRVGAKIGVMIHDPSKWSPRPG